MTQTFPDSFWWGTAASSTQAEGAAPHSDWLQFERAGRVPPSGEGNQFATRYREDFALYARHGLRHHRLGIDWARIEPEEGRRDPQAVAHYRDILVAAREAGIEPWVCLHHFVLPRWVGAMGFCDRRVRTDYWRRHVEFIAETYGDLVFGWKPINEPAAYALMGFVIGRSTPGVKDNELAMEALEGVHLASYDAALILRQGGKPVASIHALIPVFPGDSSPEAAAATDWMDHVGWRCWMDATNRGVFQVPGREPVDVPDYPGAFDLIGFSYYLAASVTPGNWLAPYPPGMPVGPSGYVQWSGGMGLVLDRLSRELPGRPILVCEHGVGTKDDAVRCRVLSESLDIVADRMRGGMDIRGFFHWTGVDNYEWSRGYDVPFGLFDMDRNPKLSAALMSSFALDGRAVEA